MNLNWNLSPPKMKQTKKRAKKRKEKEQKEKKPRKYVCNLYFTAGIYSHFSSFFYHFFHVRLLPKKNSFVFKFVAEKDRFESVSIVYLLHEACISLSHMPMPILCVLTVETDVFQYECVLAFVVPFSRQPLKMLDNILFLFSLRMATDNCGATTIQHWYQIYM